MTKRILLASAAFALASTLSLPANAAGPWTGLYLGGHVGGTWGDVDVSNTNSVPTFFDLNPGDTVTFSPNGVLGGAQIGYNYQMSNWVFGLEVEGSMMDFDETKILLFDDVGTLEAEWLATAAVRVGYALNQTSLVYVKGGYATGNLLFNDSDTVPAFTGAFSTDEMHSGWVAGAGFEHLMSDSVSVALEYDYVDLGEDTHSALTGGVVNEIGAQTHTVSVRLNWHWNPSL
jgi:outer membrane immunogenic protein